MRKVFTLESAGRKSAIVGAKGRAVEQERFVQTLFRGRRNRACRRRTWGSLSFIPSSTFVQLFSVKFYFFLEIAVNFQLLRKLDGTQQLARSLCHSLVRLLRWIRRCRTNGTATSCPRQVSQRRGGRLQLPP